ncbi:MAG TPA: hypothetical protein PLA68_01385 [Panacibacter sp.]|nr:hypothetical protein [Panacibacter sp.]
MAANKALWVNNAGFKLGTSMFAKHGAGSGTVKEIVHDGDTANVQLTKNLGVRFLGMDTPEISFQLPGSSSFVSIADNRWQIFFTNNNWQNPQLEAGLLQYLSAKIGDGLNTHTNHNALAVEAQISLENLIQADLGTSGKTKETFAFFMAFANEFLDVYGRLLTYLHADRENFTNAADAPPLSYNERQMIAGFGEPYFIWPNIQPFISIRPFATDFLSPEGFWNTVNTGNKLQHSRQAFKDARAAKKGIYQQGKELMLSAFELRFLARKSKPDRYVIDLRNTGSKELISPQKYYVVQNPEDRLFIPSEYIPVFKLNGWNAAI